jgi:hypothetical protein
MKALLIVLRILAFIVLTGYNFEYLVNIQSNTLLLILAIAIEILLFFTLIYPLIKKLLQ